MKRDTQPWRTDSLNDRIPDGSAMTRAPLIVGTSTAFPWNDSYHAAVSIL
jgi:hypothetical protein